MKVYDAEHIRNVALVGHQGSGKTTLAEAMMFYANVINRMGTVEDGTTVSDYHEEEQERQMSVFTSVLHAEWKDYKINILDTPGYLDFVGELAGALRVADTAAFVIDGVAGVQVGTEVAWQMANDFNLPSLFVLNMMDKSEANFESQLQALKDRFGNTHIAPIQLPCGQGTRAVIDVLKMKMIRFPEGSREIISEEIPAEFRERADALHNELIETIAGNDEGLMELFFEKGELTEDEMRQGLHVAMLKRELFPVFITAAKHNIGVGRLMNFIDRVCPSPTEMPPPQTVGDVLVKPDANAEDVAFVFRTMAEPHVGDFSFFRVYSGTIEQGEDLENAQTEHTERMGQIFSINGKQRDVVPKMVAGDIGAVVKLKHTHTNNTLRSKSSNAEIQPIEFPAPRYHAAVVASKSGEEDKLGMGLHRLHEEDPSLHIVHDADLKQLVLGGQGSMHLDIAKFRLKHQFGVDVEFRQPKIGYRETITKQARASYRHKKQSGGAGQFADISMLVEPLEGEFHPPHDIQVRHVHDTETAWGSKIQFIDAIVGGVIDMRRFFGAIQKGVFEKLQEGPVAGYPVGDVRVVIHSGGMHAVDSNENAFKAAARMCFVNAFKEASPVLLEPIQNVSVFIPDESMGDVLGDLNTRRARVQGMEAEGNLQVIKAHVPQNELDKYSNHLRSLTQGRGLHREEFYGYEIMPRNVQDKVVADADVRHDEE